MFRGFVPHRSTLYSLVVVAILLCQDLQADTLSIEEAVEAALTNNPSLFAIQASADALAKIKGYAGVLQEPRLSLNAQNIPVDSFSLSQEGMTQLQIGISQQLPYPGKLSLREKAAALKADAADKAVEELRLQLVRDVKKVWWNIFYIDRAMEAVDQAEALMKQLNSVAETKYEVGKGLQQDILLAQLALSKVQLESVRLQGLRSQQQARLNAMLGRAAGDEVSLPDINNDTLPNISKSEDELRGLANKGRPWLDEKQLMVHSATTMVELAKKDYYPDSMLSAVYGYRTGSNADGSERADMVSLLFSINLPIYADRRQKNIVDQRKSEWLQQKYHLEEARLQVAEQISSSLAIYRQASQQVELFKEGVLPQANQTVESMLSAYQVNKVDFDSLIRSQNSLFEYENQYWKVFSMANQALADLVAAVGKEAIYE